MGAQEQQQAANEQAAAYQDQAKYAIQYAAEQKGQLQYEIGQTVGQQAEGYASAGVTGEGTPLAMLDTTKALGQLQLNAIDLQGNLQSKLLGTEAQMAEQSGLNDLLTAEGQNVTNTQQNKISQAVQNTQALDSLLTGGISAVGSFAAAL